MIKHKLQLSINHYQNLNSFINCILNLDLIIAVYIFLYKQLDKLNFFGRLKVEMFYGEKFESVNDFIDELKSYIDYYNNERISLKLKGMSPVQYRTHSQAN